MLYNSLSDEAKNGSDCFATIDKIRHRNPLVPGTYVNLSSITAETEITVKIPLRIPVPFFLILFNLRYFPNWAGKLNIELIPTYQNLVIAPVIDDIEMINDHIAMLKERFNADVRVMPVTKFPISSTNIRKYICENKPLPPKTLSKSVYEYILDKHLYKR